MKIVLMSRDIQIEHDLSRLLGIGAAAVPAGNLARPGGPLKIEHPTNDMSRKQW
jgi:hypothetical protein